MSEFILQNQFLLITILALVTFGLSVYLGIIFYKLIQQKKEIAQLQKKHAADMAEKEQFYRDSLLIICKATLQNQCELSEACLRVQYLLSKSPDDYAHEDLAVINEMFAEIKDFDILESRKELTKQEAYNQDKKRFAIEEKYKLRMHKALETLENQLLTLQ